MPTTFETTTARTAPAETRPTNTLFWCEECGEQAAEPLHVYSGDAPVRGGSVGYDVAVFECRACGAQFAD